MNPFASIVPRVIPHRGPLTNFVNNLTIRAHAISIEGVNFCRTLYIDIPADPELLGSVILLTIVSGTAGNCNGTITCNTELAVVDSRTGTAITKIMTIGATILVSLITTIVSVP
jgi:hypothetical protein